jgi:hypothetical protein
MKTLSEIKEILRKHKNILKEKSRLNLLLYLVAMQEMNRKKRQI